VSLLDPLKRAETGWFFGRLFVPRIAVTLARAAGYGVERVPLEGGAVVAANHFSGIDHPLIGAFCPRILYFLAKETVTRCDGRASLPARGTSSASISRARDSGSAIRVGCSRAG